MSVVSSGSSYLGHDWPPLSHSSPSLKLRSCPSWSWSLIFHLQLQRKIPVAYSQWTQPWDQVSQKETCSLWPNTKDLFVSWSCLFQVMWTFLSTHEVLFQDFHQDFYLYSLQLISYFFSQIIAPDWPWNLWILDLLRSMNPSTYLSEIFAEQPLPL